MEDSETEKETALREIHEEIGLKIDFIPGFREINEYILPQTRVLKQVLFFVGEYRNQIPRYQKEELLGFLCVAYEEALKFLTHEPLKQVLQDAEHFLKNKC